MAAWPVFGGFPAGRCAQRTCDASPYKIAWSTVQSPLCFTVTRSVCRDDSAYDCCETFDNLFNKIVLTSPPECQKTVKRVTVNGTVKGGGVYFDLYDNETRGELRLTNLLLDYTNAPGSVFCLTISPPCSSLQDFCKDRNDRPCRYAVYDVAKHMCCPTCVIENGLPQLPQQQSTTPGPSPPLSRSPLFSTPAPTPPSPDPPPPNPPPPNPQPPNSPPPKPPNSPMPYSDSSLSPEAEGPDDVDNSQGDLTLQLRCACTCSNGQKK